VRVSDGCMGFWTGKAGEKPDNSGLPWGALAQLTLYGKGLDVPATDGFVLKTGVWNKTEKEEERCGGRGITWADT